MRPGSLGDGGGPGPDEDLAAPPVPGWGSPPRSGHPAAHVPPPRPARWRYRVLLAGLITALAGLAISVAAVAVHLLPRSFSPAQQQQIVGWEMGKRWRTWPAGRIFPARIPYQIPAASLDSGTVVRLDARRVGIARQASCQAATDPAAWRVLARHGCQAVLRATYQDSTGTFAVTVGVAVLPGLSQASSSGRDLPTGSGVRTVRFGRTLVAGFGDAARQLSSAIAAGPVPDHVHGRLRGWPAPCPGVRRSVRQGRDAERSQRDIGLDRRPDRRHPARPALPRRTSMLNARACLRAVGLLAALAAWGAAAAAPAGADTVRDAQLWVLNAVGAPAAWPLTEGQGTTVAVIDSGVNPNVSDLAGSVVTGPDLTGVHTPMSNPNWGVHGTWMASLIAGHGHAGGGSGIMGIAPRSKVLSIRVVTDRKDPGYATYQHQSDSRVQHALAQAIGYAVQHKVSVISMSLGYGEPSAVVRTALQNALDHGVVVVASSGNSGESVGARASGQAPYSFPADYPGVLGVAAVSRSGAAAGFSSDNLSVQVAAPGVNVPAQGRDGQYWLVSGTSPACALTAGVAALIKARYPGLAPALVVRAITSSTRNRPPGGYDDKVGFGTVDALAALTVAGRLAGHLRPAAGLLVGTYFGGGHAAVPAVPVRPRGATGLITACLAGLGCLALAGLAGAGLTALRRAGTRGQHAAAPRPPASCPPAPRPPAPAWPGPRVQASWPDAEEPG